jgi:hypothetical protein
LGRIDFTMGFSEISAYSHLDSLKLADGRRQDLDFEVDTV